MNEVTEAPAAAPAPPVKRGRGRPRKVDAQGRPTATRPRAKPKPKPKVKAAEVEVPYDQQIHLPAVPSTAHDGGPTELEEMVNDLAEDSWETESLLADAIEDLTEDSNFLADVEGACTASEAAQYRSQLHEMGPADFCAHNLDSGLVTARKLLTAFGIRPPPFLEGARDDEYYGLLTLAMSRELNKRAKLRQYNTIDDAAQLLRTSQNIMVLTGAGISTSLGIPDFRSNRTGLYHMLEKLDLPITDPQEVFNLQTFREDPSIFFTVAKDILPATKKFSPTHAFIAMLQQKGKLLTNYSQNIDNIEANAGIRPDKLVQCHGSFATASCQKCRTRVPGETIFDDIKAGRIPYCGACINALRANSRLKRKRSGGPSKKRGRWSSDDTDDDDDYNIPEAGIMKPDITFFGEALPEAFSHRLANVDRDRVDLVIIIGTSLKVAPVSEVVPYLPPHIPQIYISKTPVGHHNFDVDLLGECDVVVAELCRRAGWDLRHEMIPENQTAKIEREEGYQSRFHVTAVPAEPKSAHVPRFGPDIPISKVTKKTTF